MYKDRFVAMLAGIALGAGMNSALSAQSLDFKAPTPLTQGENRGTVDCGIGSHYWSFKFKEGKANIVVRFASMGVYGSPTSATIQLVVSEPSGKVVRSLPLTSNGPVAQTDWPWTFTGKPASLILEVRPPPRGCLLRSGGDYTISFTGPGADYAGVHAAGPEQIVGTYNLNQRPDDLENQSVRFAADGSVMTADGHKGTWKVFDPDALIYYIAIGKDHWNLKLVPGRGLCETTNLNSIVFQAIAR